MSALDPNFEQQRKSAMSAFAHDRHKRVARTLGFALTLHDGPAWAAFTAIAAARLTVPERAATAGAAVRPCARPRRRPAAHGWAAGGHWGAEGLLSG